MDKLEQSLERLINKMRKMILNLLSPLYINNMQKQPRQPINILRILLIRILQPLNPQIHISTDSPTFTIKFHMIVHIVECSFLRTEAHIE